MNRIFVDMDGVVVDFDAKAKELNLPGEELKKLPGGYLSMKPIPGAIEAVRSLIGMGYEVWLATKPPTGIPWAYADKVSWVLEHLPELKRRIVITHDKGLLGDRGDYLIDDRPHKANCMDFSGRVLHFGPAIAGLWNWSNLLNFFRVEKEENETESAESENAGA